MGQCKCGFTKDADKNCDGSHKTVRAVKEEITRKIEAISVENTASDFKLVALDIIKNA